MQDRVLIDAGLGYNRDMPQNTEKKSEQILINVEPSTFEVLSEIGVLEDRKLGYVARELMLRGLALYEADGRLRDDQKRGVSMLKKPVKLDGRVRKQKKVNAR